MRRWLQASENHCGHLFFVFTAGQSAEMDGGLMDRMELNSGAKLNWLEKVG